jgi:hypothetical protein
VILEGGGKESPISPTLWPSVGMTKNSARTTSNCPVKAKKGHDERIRLRLVQMFHDGGSRHVQRYVPDDGLVRKSVYETQQGFEEECISYVECKD